MNLSPGITKVNFVKEGIQLNLNELRILFKIHILQQKSRQIAPLTVDVLYDIDSQQMLEHYHLQLLWFQWLFSPAISQLEICVCNLGLEFDEVQF